MTAPVDPAGTDHHDTATSVPPQRARTPGS